MHTKRAMLHLLAASHPKKQQQQNRLHVQAPGTHNCLLQLFLATLLQRGEPCYLTLLTIQPGTARASCPVLVKRNKHENKKHRTPLWGHRSRKLNER